MGKALRSAHLIYPHAAHLHIGMYSCCRWRGWPAVPAILESTPSLLCSAFGGRRLVDAGDQLFRRVFTRTHTCEVFPRSMYKRAGPNVVVDRRHTMGCLFRRTAESAPRQCGAHASGQWARRSHTHTRTYMRTRRDTHTHAQAVILCSVSVRWYAIG